MRQVCAALRHLPDLRSLRACGWTCGQQPDTQRGWQTLASALPTLRHLTSLDLGDILLPDDYNAACLTLLSSGLSQLPLLRRLSITGVTRQQAHVVASRTAASEALTHSIGALTRLTHLQLQQLEGALTAQDCARNLRALTALRSLALGWWVCAPEDEPPGFGLAGAGAIAGMLAGKSRLRTLDIVCGLHVTPVAPALAALFCDRLLELPKLTSLKLSHLFLDVGACRSAQLAVCRMLAEKMVAGDLASLCHVSLQNVPTASVDELNAHIGRVHIVFASHTEDDADDADADL